MLSAQSALAILCMTPVAAFGGDSSVVLSRVFEGHVYELRLSTEGVSWHDARNECQSLGGYLATIESTAEDNLLATMITQATNAGDIYSPEYPEPNFPAIQKTFFCEYNALEVVVDIEPESDLNSVNSKSKELISVGIFTTSSADGDVVSFDAGDIDSLSLRFGADEAEIAHSQGHIEDLDGDGDLDMVVHFKAQDTGIECGHTEVRLTGMTLDGKPFEGTDSIRLTGCQGQGDPATKAKTGKVSVCHYPERGGANLISISENALHAHLAHGDVPAPPSVQTDSDCLVPQPPSGQVSASGITNAQGIATFIVPETNIIAETTVTDENGTPIPSVEVLLLAIGPDYMLIATDDTLGFAPTHAEGSLLNAQPGSAPREKRALLLRPFTSTFPGLGFLTSGNITFLNFARSHFSPTSQCFTKSEFRSFMNQECANAFSVLTNIVGGQFHVTGLIKNIGQQLLTDFIANTLSKASCPDLANQSAELTFNGKDIPLQLRMYHPPLLPGFKIFPFYFERINTCGGACCDGFGNCDIQKATNCTGQYAKYSADLLCNQVSCPEGACCFTNGACSELPPGSCELPVLAGTYQGPGTSCSPNPCPLPLGACCDPSGGCYEDTQTACSGGGGNYQGDLTTCATNPCPTGACCVGCGNCFEDTEAACIAAGGSYKGDGTTCNSAPCSGTHSFTLQSSRSLGSAGIQVPVTGDTICVLVTVPGNCSCPSHPTTGDCGLGDIRVDLRICPPNQGCTGATIQAGQGHGLNICHRFDETLGPFQFINPKVEGTSFSFNAITVSTSVVEIEIQ